MSAKANPTASIYARTIVLVLMIAGSWRLALPGAAQQDPLPIAGSYRGSWATVAGSGPIELTLTTNGDEVRGTALFENHPCGAVIQVHGRVSGAVVTAMLTGMTTAAMGNVRLIRSPRGLDGSFSFVSGCSGTTGGTLHVFGRDSVPHATPVPSASVTPVTPTPTVTPHLVYDGDCNGDARVTVDEIVTIAGIAAGNVPLAQCPAADLNGDGNVTVDELLRATYVALTGSGKRDVPEPIVRRCTLGSERECICVGDVCCAAGRCGVGEPCRRDVDCSLGLRCARGEDSPFACEPTGGVVVPPPR